MKFEHEKIDRLRQPVRIEYYVTGVVSQSESIITSPESSQLGWKTPLGSRLDSACYIAIAYLNTWGLHPPHLICSLLYYYCGHSYRVFTSIKAAINILSLLKHYQLGNCHFSVLYLKPEGRMCQHIPISFCFLAQSLPLLPAGVYPLSPNQKLSTVIRFLQLSHHQFSGMNRSLDRAKIPKITNGDETFNYWKSYSPKNRFPSESQSVAFQLSKIVKKSVFLASSSEIARNAKKCS